jgi:hypothetical protein
MNIAAVCYWKNIGDTNNKQYALLMKQWLSDSTMEDNNILKRLRKLDAYQKWVGVREGREKMSREKRKKSSLSNFLFLSIWCFL